MTGALLILAFTIITGLVLWIWERYRSRRHGPSLHHHSVTPTSPQLEPPTTSAPQQPPNLITQHPDNPTTQQPQICCGLHAICERTGQINEPPVYYDDEELDRFAGRTPGSYTESETEEFRDVLLTLLPADAAGWAVSLEKRRISLPEELLPELQLLLLES